MEKLKKKVRFALTILNSGRKDGREEEKKDLSLLCFTDISGTNELNIEK